MCQLLDVYYGNQQRKRQLRITDSTWYHYQLLPCTEILEPGLNKECSMYVHVRETSNQIPAYYSVLFNYLPAPGTVPVL